ncbi:hypothetical protein HMPREF0580_2353 [Mobiluncus mulieris ATCC 35239]|uniref:Uncharacterized protein n=1 Tax=Mobiluncus mulieris ATCC 35239 TaxID=871571 RepID=E0QTY8_9ACTO|nr:hypothetical protein HMPREF0580_2353 [Mobiluncus mulieris ATCC 35239]
MKSDSKYGGKIPHRASDTINTSRTIVELGSMTRSENVPMMVSAINENAAVKAKIAVKIAGWGLKLGKTQRRRLLS